MRSPLIMVGRAGQVAGRAAGVKTVGAKEGRGQWGGQCASRTVAQSRSQ